MAAVYFDTSIFTQPAYRRIAKATSGGRGILIELTILMWDQPGKCLHASDLAEHADTLGVTPEAVRAVVDAALKEGLWIGTSELRSLLVDAQNEGLQRRTRFLKQNFGSPTVTDTVTESVTDAVTRSDKIRSDRTGSDKIRSDKTEPEPGPLRDWWNYRRQLKKPLTEAGLAQIRKKFAERPDALRAAVEHSIAAGYQGLFEPSPQANSNGPPRKETNIDRAKRVFNELRDLRNGTTRSAGNPSDPFLCLSEPGADTGTSPGVGGIVKR